jgi:hypothetical protein
MSVPSKSSSTRLQAILEMTVSASSNRPYLKKIDSHLQDLVAAYLSGEDINKIAQTSGLKISAQKEVSVDVYVTSSVKQAAIQLASLGMTIQATNESYNVVEGRLPIGQVIPAAQLDITKAVMPVPPYVLNSEP